MSRAKREITGESCARTNFALPQITAAVQSETTMRDDLGHPEDVLKKLEAMSDLQRAILAQLAPLFPQAMHSDALREAVTPFLVAHDKKGQRRELEAAVTPLVLDSFVRYFCCIVDSYALHPRRCNIVSYFAEANQRRGPHPGSHISSQVGDERCFTIKEVAKLLGVSRMNIKRRIKNKKISTTKRQGKRGLEVVIPEPSLRLEIMSFIPNSRPLTLSDYEALVIERLDAMTLQSDLCVSNALKELCKEFKHLRAEARACCDVSVESVAKPKSKEKAPSKKEDVSARLSVVPRHPVPKSSKKRVTR
jgi:excisionase family DNA binding protein